MLFDSAVILTILLHKYALTSFGLHIQDEEDIESISEPAREVVILQPSQENSLLPLDKELKKDDAEKHKEATDKSKKGKCGRFAEIIFFERAIGKNIAPRIKVKLFVLNSNRMKSLARILTWCQ